MTRTQDGSTSAQAGEQQDTAYTWIDTWRCTVNGVLVKVTLGAFVADNRLSVKVTTTDGADVQEHYLNARDLTQRLSAGTLDDNAQVRHWQDVLADAARYGDTLQAALDSYYTERGFDSAAARQLAKEEAAAQLGF